MKNKNKKFVKFQGDMLNSSDFIQVYVFTTNHHLNVFPNLFITFYSTIQLTETFFKNFVLSLSHCLHSADAHHFEFKIRDKGFD